MTQLNETVCGLALDDDTAEAMPVLLNPLNYLPTFIVIIDVKFGKLFEFYNLL